MTGDTLSLSACSLGTLSCEADLAARLERGEIFQFPSCLFPVPTGDDLSFLLSQQISSSVHKNISFNPTNSRTAGFRRTDVIQENRLSSLFADFSKAASTWLASRLPQYAKKWQLDRATFQPEEEATRKLRPTARNDLLHIDSFPSRATNGRRILRLFVNVNPSEPRVWVTSDTFRTLIAKYGVAAGLPGQHSFGLFNRLGDEVLKLFVPGRQSRSPYDLFMRRLHDYLKLNDQFQERCKKTYWSFASGSMWLAMTDSLSHATLRGKFALDHSYFIDSKSLFLPEESPAAILKATCGFETTNQAA